MKKKKLKTYRVRASVKVELLVNYDIPARSEAEAKRLAMLPRKRWRKKWPPDEWDSRLWQEGDWNHADTMWCDAENLEIYTVDEVKK